MQYLFSLLALAATASAHIRLTALNGETGCVRLPPNNSPVTDVTSDDMVCNVDGATAAASTCSVAAGDNVTVTWDTGAHPGPEMVYMASVSDTATTDISGLSWFKISEDGLHADGTWASETVNTNGGLYSFTIPESVPAGKYLLRGETIGLHVASSEGGAQLYMSCVQVEVTGSATAAIPEADMVVFPGGYKADDPGLLINIYYPVPTSYDIPGPDPIA
ncbi:glycoside hydrolase family 61 protein [Geopyxis carbonaria]|nr:glycoside hydrolase family 61 protein [Geopyxis carbonaria]